MVVLGLLVNWLAAGAARLHDLLLRRRLHDVAQALDAAEHRDRRRRRRVSADDRLGGGDRRHRRSSRCLLFLIIFFWTPPHFWALALLRADDYARAGVPMLPVVAGADETRRQILLYSLVLVPVGVVALAARLCRRWSTARVAIARRRADGGAGLARLSRRAQGASAEPAAKQLFAFSILYLFVLFAALLVERGWLRCRPRSDA